ncbi:MAG: hypothetical protein ISS47_02725 [Candidatus Omnitrophica bacterium]|nr:hypothetical protein [Candidatus Omnitrophota bacterium]
MGINIHILVFIVRRDYHGGILLVCRVTGDWWSSFRRGYFGINSDEIAG